MTDPDELEELRNALKQAKEDASETEDWLARELLGDDPEPEGGWIDLDEHGHRLPRQPHELPEGPRPEPAKKP